MDTIRQRIISDTKLVDLSKAVLAVPEKLLTVQLELAKADHAVATFTGVKDAEEELGRIESEIAFEVSLETVIEEYMGTVKDGEPVDPYLCTKDTGKPKFKNDTARKAETSRRCRNDLNWGGWQQGVRAQTQKYNDLLWTAAEAKVAFKVLLYTHQSVLAVLDLATGLCKENTTDLKLEAIAKIAQIGGNNVQES